MTMQSTQSDAEKTRNRRELLLVLIVLFLSATVLALLLTHPKNQIPTLVCPKPTLSCPQPVCPNLSAGNNSSTQLTNPTSSCDTQIAKIQLPQNTVKKPHAKTPKVVTNEAPPPGTTLSSDKAKDEPDFRPLQRKVIRPDSMKKPGLPGD